MDWNNDKAYAVGLLATDGCLSKDGRHIDLTSDDIEMLENFNKCFGFKTKISYKISGYSGKRCPRIQFSNVALYRDLISIGLTPKKSLTIGVLKIPNKYFFDFFRGCFDGDGCIYSYFDPRWKNSFMFYLNFTSASPRHIDWLREKVYSLTGSRGHIAKQGDIMSSLRYAKADSRKIIALMYRDRNCVCLSRKINKVNTILKIDADVL